jgi:diacylglycerol kinase
MTEFTVILIVVVINFFVSLFVGEFVFKRYLIIIEKLEKLNRDMEDIVDKIFERDFDNVEAEVKAVKDAVKNDA